MNFMVGRLGRDQFLVIMGINTYRDQKMVIFTEAKWQRIKPTSL